MSWRIVEIPDAESTPTDLTNSELTGVSIMMGNCCGEPYDEGNVYWRAWMKIYPLGKAANEREYEEEEETT